MNSLKSCFFDALAGEFVLPCWRRELKLFVLTVLTQKGSKDYFYSIVLRVVRNSVCNALVFAYRCISQQSWAQLSVQRTCAQLSIIDQVPTRLDKDKLREYAQLDQRYEVGGTAFNWVHTLLDVSDDISCFIGIYVHISCYIFNFDYQTLSLA